MQNEMIFDPAEFFVAFDEGGTCRFMEDDISITGYVRRADAEGLLVELAAGNPVVAEWSVVRDAGDNPLALDIAQCLRPELPENAFLRARDLCARAAKEVERICSVPYEIAERFYP